jgi:hypothetical protein
VREIVEWSGEAAFGEILESVLAQQLIQPSIERVTRAVGRSVVVTRMVGCRSRSCLTIAIREV